MKASVKSIDLIDHENWAYWPDDEESFCVAAEALIGPIEEEGGDIFSFEICTAKWFFTNKNRVTGFARAIIFVPEYDEQTIRKTVTGLVARTSGSTWVEIGTKLSRYLRWEFEDYLD